MLCNTVLYLSKLFTLWNEVSEFSKMFSVRKFSITSCLTTLIRHMWELWLGGRIFFNINIYVRDIGCIFAKSAAMRPSDETSTHVKFVWESVEDDFSHVWPLCRSGLLPVRLTHELVCFLLGRYLVIPSCLSEEEAYSSWKRFLAFSDCLFCTSLFQTWPQVVLFLSGVS